MSKSVIVRCRSKITLDEPDITVNVSLPTIDEAVKGSPELKAAFEHAAHATFIIGLQSMLRANALLEKVSDREPAQAVANGVDFSTLGTRQRGGLTDNKLKAALGEIAATGNVNLITEAIGLHKAGDMVKLEAYLRKHATKTFAKVVKAEAKPVVKA